MTSTTPHSSLFSEESLRRAVSEMMGHTVKPVTPCPPYHVTVAHGRQLIAGLGEISSLASLMDYEEDLRATLASREVSSRGKIARLQLEEECLWEESCILMNAEQAARSVMVNEYNAMLAIPAALMSLAGREEQVRLDMALEYRAAVKRLRRVAASVELLHAEWSARRCVECAESLHRREMTHRRFIEIGECAQMARHGLSHAEFRKSSWLYSTAHLAALRRLNASEAADRESLELMFRFHRATMVTAEKAARASAMRDSVEWISTQDTLRRQGCVDG